MLPIALDKVIKGENLTQQEMMRVMTEIMEGLATPSQIGAFLVALRMKGETLEEITGSAKVMKEKALNVDIKGCYAIDTCGTGGDGANTFNISTIVALIAAAAGVKVVKHGNRSVSSRCGSADVLEQLGVKLELEPGLVARCVEELNIGFIFAPNYHKAMFHVAQSRREMGVRTIFNLLGPLTNPALVRGQVLGVFDPKLTEVLAGVLLELGAERAMVVHGLDGLDEITLTTKTKVSELKDGLIQTYLLDPEEYGFNLATPQELVGGDAQDNAEIIVEILKGSKGPKRDIVLLNAGAAIYVGKKARTLQEGIEAAQKVLDNGLALGKLQQLVAFSRGKVAS